jgi:HD-GYP domain-containing protein (c-di-GMP phosphodiesterase class II)
MVDSVGRNPDALLWLTKLKTQDSYAYDHGIDVAIYMLAFGRHLGYPKESLHILGMSGLMQDIGKLKVRAEVLNKATKLSAAEFEEVKYHVNHSLEILRTTVDIPKDVLHVVSQHHERHDGSGYPRGLHGDQIHTYAYMAGIVDCFEALVSERPYAAAVSTHQALQQLNRWKGSSFHEALTEQFIQCIGIFPVGSLVELNTGDVAVVVGQNKIRRLKPKVMLLLDPGKQAYKYPIMLDLINDPVGTSEIPYQIKRDLPSGAYGIDPREYYL